MACVSLATVRSVLVSNGKFLLVYNTCETVNIYRTYHCYKLYTWSGYGIDPCRCSRNPKGPTLFHEVVKSMCNNIHVLQIMYILPPAPFKYNLCSRVSSSYCKNQFNLIHIYVTAWLIKSTIILCIGIFSSTWMLLYKLYVMWECIKMYYCKPKYIGNI